MFQFRLRTATVAVRSTSTGKGEAALIPAGSEIITRDPEIFNVSTDKQGMVKINLQKNEYSVFLVDLLQRGELIRAADE